MSVLSSFLARLSAEAYGGTIAREGWMAVAKATHVSLTRELTRLQGEQEEASKAVHEALEACDESETESLMRNRRMKRSASAAAAPDDGTKGGGGDGGDRRRGSSGATPSPLLNGG